MIRTLPLVAAALLAGATQVRPPVAFAGSTVLNVTKTEDTADGACDADCSLREAIIAANASPGANLVMVPASSSPYVLTNGAGDEAAQFGDLDILTEITVQGAGVDQTLIDGDASDTVFDVLPGGSLTLADLTVQSGFGVGGSEAGGIFAEGSLTLQSVRVRNNAGGDGGAGGVYASGDLAIEDSEIVDNTAGAGGAGGVYSAWDAAIEDTLISGNTAMGTGAIGGAYLEWAADLMDLTISDNEATGANATGGLYTYLDEGASLSRVTVSENTASGDYAVGGWWNFAAATAEDVVVDANSGGEHGAGGVFNECCGGALDLSRAAVTRNTAPGDSAGGIANDSAALLTNVTISGNSAGADSAGGLYNGQDATLVNVTIAANSAGAGGASGAWNDGSLTARNTIIDGACLDTGTTASEGGNVSSGAGCGFTAQSDQENIDPLLGALSDNGGFSMTQALVTGSPAIDAGVGCPPPATDQRGIARPQGAACDSGAYESGGAPAQLVWGDIRCNGGVAGDDAGAVLAAVSLEPGAQAAGTGCPQPAQVVDVVDWFDAHLWGDVNCDGLLDVFDALYLLLSLADVAAAPAGPCPEIGESIELG